MLADAQKAAELKCGVDEERTSVIDSYVSKMPEMLRADADESLIASVYPVVNQVPFGSWGETSCCETVWVGSKLQY